MKIVHRHLNPNGPGTIKMIAEDEDDLWLAYKLTAKDDCVTALTVRKVLRESLSKDVSSKRVKMEIEISVEAVDYYKEKSLLRVRGRNLTKNEHIKIEKFHTLEIELKRPFALRKKLWEIAALEELDRASDTKSSADLAVVLIQEGWAYIVLVGKSDITTCSHIKTSIPRKTRASAADNYEKALIKFFNDTSQALLRQIDFNFVRCVVIAGPGFTKDRFHQYLLSDAERANSRPVIENKSCMILVQATSGSMSSLSEVLDNPDTMSKIIDTKNAKEVRALEDFNAMSAKDPYRTCYGPKHVEIAHERMAIQTLLITDELFRSCNVSTRQKYFDLVESVKGLGGKVHIFSRTHPSGEQLVQLSGVAAILWFPLPDLDDIEV